MQRTGRRRGQNISPQRMYVSPRPHPPIRFKAGEIFCPAPPHFYPRGAGACKHPPPLPFLIISADVTHKKKRLFDCFMHLLLSFYWIKVPKIICFHLYQKEKNLFCWRNFFRRLDRKRWQQVLRIVTVAIDFGNCNKVV